MGLSLIIFLLYNVKTIAQGCIANAKYHRMEGITFFSFFVLSIFFIHMGVCLGGSLVP